MKITTKGIRWLLGGKKGGEKGIHGKSRGGKVRIAKRRDTARDRNQCLNKRKVENDEG